MFPAIWPFEVTFFCFLSGVSVWFLFPPEVLFWEHWGGGQGDGQCGRRRGGSLWLQGLPAWLAPSALPRAAAVGQSRSLMDQKAAHSPVPWCGCALLADTEQRTRSKAGFLCSLLQQRAMRSSREELQCSADLPCSALPPAGPFACSPAMAGRHGIS